MPDRINKARQADLVAQDRTSLQAKKRVMASWCISKLFVCLCFILMQNGKQSNKTRVPTTSDKTMQNVVIAIEASAELTHHGRQWKSSLCVQSKFRAPLPQAVSRIRSQASSPQEAAIMSCLTHAVSERRGDRGVHSKRKTSSELPRLRQLTGSGAKSLALKFKHLKK